MTTLYSCDAWVQAKKRMKILADATLPYLHELFQSKFELSCYHSETELHALLPQHDLLLCRSTLKVDEELLKHSNLRCVATASSGIDHIDTSTLVQRGITCLDAKGCNAHAVADYIVATLAELQRQGFSLGKKAGVMGYGEVGSRVVKRLQALGYSVLVYDPFIHNMPSNVQKCTLADLASVDLLCLHPNLHHNAPYASYHLIDAAFLRSLNPKAIVINAARGEIIDELALINHPHRLIYCTDVYHNEPNINPDLVKYATLCTPHIAGHSLEAKLKAITVLAQRIHTFADLRPPRCPSIPSPNLASKFNKAPWQDVVHHLYSPAEDTLILKRSEDKKHAFLTQRKAHQDRHDFCAYTFEPEDKLTQALLGRS
ncbi:MAG: 4-phosphoerythronate dehydrogenase [Legionellaceae bacterium]